MEPFVGEIRQFGGNFAPKGWALCNGQLLPIAQNMALFSILGVNFGGDGKTTFGLPNLQAAFPVGQGAGPGLTPRQVGETGGVATVALQASQMPAHTHTMMAAPTATTGTPGNSVTLAPTPGPTVYRQPGARVAMDGATIGITGTGAAHENRQPYLALNFIIALVGIYPARS